MEHWENQIKNNQKAEEFKIKYRYYIINLMIDFVKLFKIVYICLNIFFIHIHEFQN